MGHIWYPGSCACSAAPLSFAPTRTTIARPSTDHHEHAPAPWRSAAGDTPHNTRPCADATAMAGSGGYRRDNRSPEAEAYRRLYKTSRWQKLRARQLASHPLCAMCQGQGRVTPATVCDHIDPKIKRDPARFFDGPFQSLCDDPRYRCHSSGKQRIEKGSLPRVTIGRDGWPID